MTDFVLTPPKPSRASVVRVGDRDLCTDGLVHPSLVADYLKDHARVEWLSVGQLAKVFTGASTIDGKRRVRRQLHNVFTHLLRIGDFLVYDVDKASRRIAAVKLLNTTAEEERQAATLQLERMKRRREISAEKYDIALGVIAIIDRVTHERQETVTA